MISLFFLIAIVTTSPAVRQAEESLEGAMMADLKNRAHQSLNNTYKSWQGDISSSSSLVEAMRLVTYQNSKAAIFFADSKLYKAHQMAARLSKLKLLDQALFLTISSSLCSESAILIPHLSCCWSDPTPSLRYLTSGQAGKILALQKSMISARITALGFNVLILDTDSIMFRDPFPHLEAPPLDKFAIIAVRGWSPSTASTSVVFVRSSGATARVLEEFSSRSIEWQEMGQMVSPEKKLVTLAAAMRLKTRNQSSGNVIAALRPVSPLLHGFYQRQPSGCSEASQLTDVLLSNIGSIGSQVRLHCLQPWRSNKGSSQGSAAKKWMDSHMEEMKKRGLPGGIRSLFDQLIVDIGPEMENLVNSRRYEIDHTQLASGKVAPSDFLPHEAVYEEVKKMKPSRARIEFKMQMLRDKNSQSNLAIGSDNSSALFAYAPHWLFSTFSIRGRLGYWDERTVGGRPSQVIGSMRGEKADVGSEAITHALNLYEWDAVHLALKSQGGSTAPGSLPKVIGLSPGLTDMLTNKGGLVNALLGLAEIAVVSGRIPLWPSIPCDPKVGSSIPLAATYLEAIPFGPLGSLRCVPDSFISSHCLIPSTTMWRSDPFSVSLRSLGGSVRGVLDVEGNHLIQLLNKSGDERSGYLSLRTTNAATSSGVERKWWEGANSSHTGSKDRSVSLEVVNATSPQIKTLIANSHDIVLHLTHPIRVSELTVPEASRVETLAKRCPEFKHIFQ